MSKKIKVMIVEDNPQFSDSICEYFDGNNDIEITGVSYDSFEAIELLNKGIPDVILLDLVMPKADGFVLLQHLMTVKLEKKPLVIVLSALSNEIILKRANDMGAAYFMAKPFSMSILYERIMELAGKEQIAVNKPTRSGNSSTLDEKISTILLTIGIPSHLKGYKYLFEGVKMIVNKPNLTNKVTKQLYPEIGEVFGTTVANVERAIRTVIDAAINSGKLEKLNELFGHDVYTKNAKFTSSEILSLVANYVLQKS